MSHEFSYGGIEFVILIVEDDNMVLNLHKHVLRILGLNFNAFTDSDSALLSFKRMPDLYDAAILDVFLPGSEIDGYNLAIELRMIKQSLPVLFVTGLNDEYNIRLLKKYGHYLRKPFFTNDLVQAIQETTDKLHYNDNV